MAVDIVFQILKSRLLILVDSVTERLRRHHMHNGQISLYQFIQFLHLIPMRFCLKTLRPIVHHIIHQLLMEV